MATFFGSRCDNIFDKKRKSWTWYDDYEIATRTETRRYFSYDTHIATINRTQDKMTYFNQKKYSRTTSKYSSKLLFAYPEYSNRKEVNDAIYEDGKWILKGD